VGSPPARRRFPLPGRARQATPAATPRPRVRAEGSGATPRLPLARRAGRSQSAPTVAACRAAAAVATSRRRDRSSGPALAEAIEFSGHALDRFAQRGPGAAVDRDEPTLRLLIARQGVVLARPPAWFHGSAPDGGVLVGIAGRFVVPLVRAPIRAGALPSRPWRAVTFVSRELAADLARVSGEDLAAPTFLPQRVVGAWAAHTPGSTAATGELRAALAAIPAGAPALSTRPASVAGRDELHVRLPGGTLVLVRADRREGHGARLRATAWLARRADGDRR
jgi:hypothetical protein